MKNNIILLINIVLVALLVLNRCETQKQFQDLTESVYGRDEILSKEINELGQSVTTATTKMFNYDSKLAERDERFLNLEKRLKPNGDKLKELQASVGFLTKQIEKYGNTSNVKLPEILIAKDTIEVPVDFIGTQWEFESDYITILSTLEENFQLKHKYSLAPSNFYVDILKKKKGLFRKPEYLTKISTDNELIDIQETDVFLKRIPKPTWSIVLGAGVSASYLDNNVKIFPSLNLTLGRNIATIKYK